MTPQPRAGTRAGLLVAWAGAWIAGRAAYDDVLTNVTGNDEPHRVVGLPGAAADERRVEPDPIAVADPSVPLGWLLPELRRHGGCALVLPAPGDPRGVPPGDFGAAALTAGEGVVVGAGDAGLGLVPSVTRHGSDIGSGTVFVRWDCFPIDGLPLDPLGVPEAEHDLADALRSAAAELAELDVASWRPESAAAVAGVRRAAGPSLPAGHDQRAIRLLAQADRLAAVLDLADADAPGGAVTAAEALARSEALRPLGRAVRRARLAAYNADALPRR
ncbi:MAG: hypothetical protein ACR2F6_01550 [Mycobacteriales bacterium]